jgi:hypothetical protein
MMMNQEQVLWCRSLSHRYFCIVAVQHSHSGEIKFRKFLIFFSPVEKSVLMICYYIFKIKTIIFID